MYLFSDVLIPNYQKDFSVDFNKFINNLSNGTIIFV